MNVLILNDDGPESFGLKLLREAVKQRFRENKTITLTTHKPMTGQSFGITATWTTEALMNRSLKEIEPDFYTVEAKPVDLVYIAFCYPERFLPPGATFDAVFSGVNYGHNVGLDVLHSGTVAQVMLAASVFGAHATAFSQEMDQLIPGQDGEADDIIQFDTASKLLSNYFAQTPTFEPAEAYNVNFTRYAPRGWKNTKVAPYSRWRRLPTLPVNDKLEDDIQYLAKGFCTISPLDVKVNPTLRY